MKTAVKLITGILFLTMFGCTNNSNKAIKSVVDTFYKNYKTNFRTVDNKLLTQDLSVLINKAIAKEMFEAEKVKKSKFPTDKPLLIEGDIFTSLYEGQNSFKIGAIKTTENKATVTVQFTNTLNKEIWNDQVILIKDTTWKIDNVLFKEHVGNEKSTKEILISFCNAQSNY